MTQCSKCRLATIWVEKNKGLWQMFDFAESGGKKVATYPHEEKCPARLQAEAEKSCPFCWINNGMSPINAIRMEYRPCKAHENGSIVFDGTVHACTPQTIINLASYIKRRQKSEKVAIGNYRF